MGIDKGTMAGVRLVNGEVRILLRDELAIAGEEGLGGGKEAQGCAGVLDVRPEPAASDCDRRVLPSLKDAIGDRRFHAEPELGVGARSPREVPAEAMTPAIVARHVDRQIQVRELDPQRRRGRAQPRAVIRIAVDLTQDGVEKSP
jgi:hypothetical protein